MPAFRRFQERLAFVSVSTSLYLSTQGMGMHQFHPANEVNSHTENVPSKFQKE